MPHNISINQHLYVICDTPYVIHMLHTPFLHLVITVNQELGKESAKVFWGKKIQNVLFWVVYTIQNPSISSPLVLDFGSKIFNSIGDLRDACLSEGLIVT